MGVIVGDEVVVTKVDEGIVGRTSEKPIVEEIEMDPC